MNTQINNVLLTSSPKEVTELILNQLTSSLPKVYENSLTDKRISKRLNFSLEKLDRIRTAYAPAINGYFKTTNTSPIYRHYFYLRNEETFYWNIFQPMPDIGIDFFQRAIENDNLKVRLDFRWSKILEMRPKAKNV